MYNKVKYKEKKSTETLKGASEDEEAMRLYRGDKINTKNKTKFAKETKVIEIISLINAPK